MSDSKINYKGEGQASRLSEQHESSGGQLGIFGKNAQNHDFILSVTRVDLIHQELEVIPAEITAFVNLEELNLSENTIAEIPPEIGSLVNVEGLYLGGNQISEIPPEMGALVNLEELNLSENI